jgi:pyridinium-3,5-biscarboxylic acid mononucleotide synthase
MIQDDLDDSLRELLDAVAAGHVSAAEAAGRLADLGVCAVGDYARLDLGRARRKHVPEIVYSPGKTTPQLVEIVAAFVRGSGAVLCSKTSPEQAQAVLQAAAGEAVYDERSRVLVVRGLGYQPPPDCGAAGVLAAGTGDVPAAEEAAAVCRLMGVRVYTSYDVGVAGLHRLGGPLKTMLDADVSALVVAAGMEGALPSVVAGMVDVPVIGLPTSTGYGLGGNGEAALLGMLQTCSPGLSVVNVDNGVGAGATAALIARRAGACRSEAE